MHGDLCGPVSPATPGGRRFFLLLVDDAMRFMWVSLLTTKSATADAIKRTQAEAEKVCGRKLNVLRTDNGREFTAGEFADYYADEGITRHYSAPYSPQQNGVVERRNQTVVGLGHGAGTAQAAGHAGQVLGRGDGHRGAPVEQVADQELVGQDALRGLARASTGGGAPARLRLPLLRQGAEPGAQAR